MNKDFLVGLVFLLALMGLATLSLSVSGIGFLQKSHSLTITFDDVSGLSQGDSVVVSGVPIGEVRQIHPPNDDGVSVELSLMQNYDQRQGTNFKVKAAGPLGGYYVDYHPGTGQLLTPPEREKVRGSGSSDAFAMLGELLEENSTLRNILRGIESAINDINAGKGLLGALIHDPNFRDDFARISENLATLLEQATSGQGAFGRVLQDPEIAASLDRVPRILETIEQISEDIRDANGPLGAVISDPEMKGQLKRFFDNVDGGKGLIGRIVSDEQLGAEFAGIVSRIDATLIQFVEGEGAIARLIRDPEIGQAFERTVIGLSETVEKINNGDGTIGRLVNDDEILDEATQTIILLRDVTEDAREQAPVNAFLNALFGFF